MSISARVPAWQHCSGVPMAVSVTHERACRGGPALWIPSLTPSNQVPLFIPLTTVCASPYHRTRRAAAQALHAHCAYRSTECVVDTQQKFEKRTSQGPYENLGSL